MNNECDEEEERGKRNQKADDAWNKTLKDNNKKMEGWNSIMKTD